MLDYQKLYYTLFNKITDLIEELQDIQKLAEEMYLAADDPQDPEKQEKPSDG